MIIIDALLIAYAFMLIIGAMLLAFLILGVGLIVVGLIRYYEKNREDRKNKYTGKRKTKKPVYR